MYSADRQTTRDLSPRSKQGPLLLVGLFVASLALRPQLVGIGPLLSSIQQSLGVSHAVAGLLSTVVVLCMGLFAPSAFWFARHVGPRWAIAGALVLIAGFGVGRVLVAPALALILLTIPVGFGIAVAGSLMPLVVRHSWPERPVLGTAIYATGINAGAAIAAAAAVPLAHSLGSWRDSLEVFSFATLALALVWVASSGGYHARAPTATPLSRLPIRTGTGWMLVAIFSLLSITYYGINAWLPAAFTQRGWSESSAGGLLTVINAVTVPVSLLLAFRGDVFGTRRFWLTSGATLLFGGVLGVILLPAGGWAWAAMIGAAIGLLFPSVMTLPLDVADHPSDVGSMTAMMLGAGYLISAAGPFLLGLLRDVAGSFTLSMWLMAATSAGLLLIALLNSHDRLRRDPREPRATEGAQSAAVLN